MVDCLWTAKTYRRPRTQLPRDVPVPASHRGDFQSLSGEARLIASKKPSGGRENGFSKLNWRITLQLTADPSGGFTMARIIFVKAARPRESPHQHQFRAAQSWQLSWRSRDEADVRTSYWRGLRAGRMAQERWFFCSGSLTTRFFKHIGKACPSGVWGKQRAMINLTLIPYPIVPSARHTIPGSPRLRGCSMRNSLAAQVLRTLVSSRL